MDPVVACRLVALLPWQLSRGPELHAILRICPRLRNILPPTVMTDWRCCLLK